MPRHVDYRLKILLRKKHSGNNPSHHWQIFLYSLNYLSHALIFSYLEYSPAPKNVWKEINFIYDFAESLKQENTTIASSESFPNKNINTIADAYKRILLASLADPHHLPYGAIWEIYEQLSDWIRLIEISPFEKTENDINRFVANLQSDNIPIPYSKFNLSKASDKHRIIDATKLYKKINEHLHTIESSGRPEKSIVISPYFAKMILEHLTVVWGRPPKRSSPRKQRSGKLELACGLNDVYYFLNNQEEFSPPPIIESEEDLEYEIINNPTAPMKDYKTDIWELVDQSSRGFAVIRKLKPAHNIKVGELVIIDTKNSDKKWAIGTVRWLMIKDGEIFRIGAQIISTDTRTAAIRACTGSAQDMRYRRAFLLSNNTGNGNSIITDKGMFIKNREIELNIKGNSIKAITGSLTESTTGFEQFTINKNVSA